MTTLKTIQTASELNEQLIKVLTQKIATLSGTGRGDAFDTMVKNIFHSHLPGIQTIDHHSWAHDDHWSGYRQKSMGKNFDFTDQCDIEINQSVKKLFLIDKPNGGNQWPDLLLVFDKIGLPIEIKSSNDDIIVWNGGMPRENGLYIFNCGSKQKTTFFLGQEVLSQEKRDRLLAAAQIATIFNQFVSDDEWKYYVRNMFVSNRSYFEMDDLTYRERIGKIEKHLSDQNPKAKLLTKVQKKQQELEQIQMTQQSLVDKRVAMEASVTSYINSLTWNVTQTTRFNDEEHMDAQKIKEVQAVIESTLSEKFPKETPSKGLTN